MKRLLSIVGMLVVVSAASRNVVPGVHDLAEALQQFTDSAFNSIVKKTEQSRMQMPLAVTTTKCNQVQALVPNCQQVLGDIQKNTSALHSGCSSSCMTQMRSILNGLTSADAACIDALGENSYSIHNLTLNMKYFAFLCSNAPNSGGVSLCGDSVLAFIACTNNGMQSNYTGCMASGGCQWSNGACSARLTIPFMDLTCGSCMRYVFTNFAAVGFANSVIQVAPNVDLNFMDQIICAKSSDQKAYCVRVLEDQPMYFSNAVEAQLMDEASTAGLCTNVTLSSCVRTYTMYIQQVAVFGTIAAFPRCLVTAPGTSDRDKYVYCASAQQLGGELLSAAQIGRVLDVQCSKNATGHYCFAADLSNPTDPFVACLADLAHGQCNAACTDDNVTRFLLQSGCCGGTLLNYAATVVNVTFPRYNGTGTISNNDLPYLGGVSLSTITDCLQLTTQEIQAPSFQGCNDTNTTNTKTVSLILYFNINYEALILAMKADFTALAVALAIDLATMTGQLKSAFRNFKFSASGKYQTTSLLRHLFQENSGLAVSLQAVVPTNSASSLGTTLQQAVVQGANFQATLTAVVATCSDCVSGTTLTPTGVSTQTSGAAQLLISIMLVSLLSFALVML